jgi:hypothetical protein
VRHTGTCLTDSTALAIWGGPSALGKTRGRQADRRLADMSIPAPREPVGYELPNPDEREDYNNRIVLATGGHELYVTYGLWRDRLVVEFAVGQIVRHNGAWVEVARIDTCHGNVHHHQLRKSRPADTVGVRVILEELPSDNPWKVVDSWYERALDKMETEWQERLRRWRRG